MDPSQVEQLTDKELFDKLKFYKINCGPVQPTTRALYENRLKKHLKSMRIPAAATREPPLPSIKGISPIRIEPEINPRSNVEANKKKQEEVIFIKQEPTSDNLSNQKPDIVFEYETTQPISTNNNPPTFTDHYEHSPVQYRRREPELVHRPVFSSKYRSRQPEAPVHSLRQPHLFSRDPPVRQPRMEFRLLTNPYNQQNTNCENVYRQTEENFSSRRLINLDTDALFNKQKNNTGLMYDEPGPPQPFRYNRDRQIQQTGTADSQSTLTIVLLAVVVFFILVYGAVTFLSSTESTVEIY